MFDDNPNGCLFSYGRAMRVVNSLCQRRHCRVYRFVLQGASSILHGHPEGKTFLPFRQTFAAIFIK